MITLPKLLSSSPPPNRRPLQNIPHKFNSLVTCAQHHVSLSNTTSGKRIITEVTGCWIGSSCFSLSLFLSPSVSLFIHIGPHLHTYRPSWSSESPSPSLATTSCFPARQARLLPLPNSSQKAARHTVKSQRTGGTRTPSTTQIPTEQVRFVIIPSIVLPYTQEILGLT